MITLRATAKMHLKPFAQPTISEIRVTFSYPIFTHGVCVGMHVHLRVAYILYNIPANPSQPAPTIQALLSSRMSSILSDISCVPVQF